MHSLSKSNLLSENYRRHGNKSYQDSKFHEALRCYNKALCYVKQPKSNEAALLYGNRSAVYFELKLADKCIENIDMAIDAGCQEEKRKLLNIRKEKCYEMQKNQRETIMIENYIQTIIKLSYPAYEKTPFLANCVELREAGKSGRGMFANRDLKVGDIIGIVDPVMRSLNKEAVFTNCINCLGMNSLNLFPCPSCVGAMFCSKKCQEEANETFHKYECHQIDDFLNESNTNSAYSSWWRSFMKAHHAVGGFENLKQICNDKELRGKTFFDYDLRREGNESLAKNEFLSALGCLAVIPTDHIFDTSEIEEDCVNSEAMLSFWKTENEKNEIKKILGILWKISYSPLSRRNFSERLIYGSGIALPLNHFNHSCSPNVATFTSGGKEIFLVTCPVKKDQQLFASRM